ncbi:MAG: hypothetical protein H7239_04050 [Flavobacterium sp.]|nr:hypothetical protein [Flavobacterium sp.]
MKSKIFFFSLIITLIISCSPPSKKFSTTYNTANKEGMVVGTICIVNKSYSEYSFLYTDDLPGINDYPNLSNFITFKNTSGDFNEKGNSYYLFTIVKPNGKYKFAKLKIFDNSGQKQSRIEFPVDIKFNIEEGKTNYLGQLTIDTKKKSFTLENQLERDREWFTKKIPSIQF